MSRMLRWTNSERALVYAEVAKFLPEYKPHSKAAGRDQVWVMSNAQRVLARNRQHSNFHGSLASKNFKAALEWLRENAPEQQAQPEPIVEDQPTPLEQPHDAIEREALAALEPPHTAMERMAAIEQQLAETREDLRHANALLERVNSHGATSFEQLERQTGDVSLGGVFLGAVVDFGIKALVGILRNEDVVNAVRALNNDAPKYQRHNPFAMDWAPKENKLKIAVIGVEPRQREDLLNDPEFAEYDIRCWTKDESTDKLSAMVRKADIVIEVMFVRHGVTQMARDTLKGRPTYRLDGFSIEDGFPRFVMARGTISSVKNYLRALGAHKTPLPQANGAAQPEHHA